MSDCYYDDAGCLVCPEQEAQDYVPPRVERRAVFGWNAGANSIVTVDGDLHTVFDMPLGEIGAIIGLKSDRKQPIIPSLIEHGWYFQSRGGADLVQPIERGVPIGNPVAGRSASTVFEIRRVGGRVRYFMAGALVHTSAVPSSGVKLVNCCLYASGDGAPSGIERTAQFALHYQPRLQLSDQPPPISGSYLQLASGATPRECRSTAAIDGKMYIFDGFGGGRLNDLWRYDPASNSWAQLTTGATARNGSSAVAINGKMYIFAGYTGSRPNDLWCYDPATDTWAQLASGATGRNFHSAVAVAGKMYVFGGFDGSAFLNDLWCYDPTTDTWVELTAGATARNGSSAVAINGKMYIFGGSRLGDLWCYDPATDTWAELASGPAGRSGHAAVPISGKMYIFGGSDTSNTDLNDLWRYDPATDTWAELTPGATARHYAAAVPISGKMYIFGGTSNGTDLDDLWVVS